MIELNPNPRICATTVGSQASFRVHLRSCLAIAQRVAVSNQGPHPASPDPVYTGSRAATASLHLTSRKRPSQKKGDALAVLERHSSSGRLQSLQDQNRRIP